MAGNVTSTSSSAVRGQSVQAQLSVDLAPAIPRDANLDEFIINGTNYNVNTQQYLQVQGVSPDAKIELTQRAGKTGNLGFQFTIVIHPTQQLWSGNQGTRFYIHFIDDISLGFDFPVFEIEWGYDPSIGKGVIQVWQASTKLGEVQVTGYIPASKQIVVQSFNTSPGVFSVAYDGTTIASANYDSGNTPPFKVKYGEFKLGGQPSSITWPAGHPAQSPAYPGWIFNQAELTGNWRPFEPTWTAQALDSGGAQIGSLINPTSIGYNSDDTPYANFTVPNHASIATLRIKATMHTISASALGFDTLDIPITGGGSAALVVNGLNPAPLLPGQQYIVTANYPTSELTFAALGGGSFGTGANANVYTAPTDAGGASTYQFTVTRAATSETVTVGVIVPVVITPSAVSMVGSTTQVFTTNGDIATWSSTGGSLSGSAARSRTYTAPTSVGTYNVTATMTGGASATATITVTSSGTTPTSGLRLEPSAGYSVSLNAQPQVKLIGDISPALWATTNNFNIDGATGNLRLVTNTANAEAILAQAVPRVVGGTSTFTWAFNSTQQLAAGDSGQFVWEFRTVAGVTLGSVVFSYLGSGEDWDVAVFQTGVGELTRQAFTRTNTSGIKVDFTATTPANQITVSFRASDGTGYSQIAVIGSSATNEPRLLVAKFNPSITSKSNGSVLFNKPAITAGFGKWYQPQWQAARVDVSGNVLGSYSLTTSEDTALTEGSFAQIATINCNAVGTARVRATYPSGVAAVNDVFITITSSGTALAVTIPAAGTTTDIAPGGQLTVEANDTPSALTYNCPGGTFGSGASKNIFTAGATAGFFTLTVSRGSEVVTRQIRVLMRVTPTSQTINLGQQAFLSVNTVQAISVSATGGTVGIIGTSSGTTQLLYTPPAFTGTFTVNVTSSINNSSATVTVQASGSSPINISNTEPITVEPGNQVQIVTNYSAGEVTFGAAAGTFGTGLQKDIWTAPSTAGFYTITVNHATGGTDTAQAFVPVRLTPKNPTAVSPGAQIQFTVNYPTVTWGVSAGGGSISAGGLWTAGSTPGSFTITVGATISSTTYNDTTPVTVSTTGLALNVPSAVTLQPGQTLTITANYPTGELTFSATGGTFSGNVYTAPNDAGVYTITVSRAGQTATVTVTVPVVISPATISLGNGATQTFTVNSNVTNFATTGWSATGGTLSSQAIRTVVYTAGSTAGTYTVQAITVLGTVTATITNTGTASVPIVITGPAAVTIEPASTYLIETNKPVGSYSLTATGGTFEGNSYRAPNQAGTYTITVTDTSGSGAGADTLSVTVPLRVTPVNALVTPGQTQQFNVNYPANDVTWSTGPGLDSGLITAFGFWTSPTTPGQYTITATTPIGSATATASVQALELVVYGPDNITLDSGQQYLVLTNIPRQGVTFTAFGGSFVQNIYTAPSQAGQYHFTASVPGQTKQVNVTVPLRIQPDTVHLTAGQTQQFTINAPSASWAVVGSGTISQTGFYTAPASGGTVATIIATTPNGSDTATVLLLDPFPYQPNYALTVDSTRAVVIVESEDATRFGRVKGPTRKHYELKFNNRGTDELKAALAFHTSRFPEAPFLFEDIKLDLFVAVLFDSAFRWEVAGDCRFSYSFRLIEV